ncbi:MAG: ATP-binding protein, partial [Anaerovoracaceae bacterium]
WAHGIWEDTIAGIKENFINKAPLHVGTHERMMELFRYYIAVGGMPEVVNEYIESKNFKNIIKLQKNIVKDYLDDIAKYAEGAEKAKARACFLSVPAQLSKDYKKFQYSKVEKKGRASKYGGSLNWLFDASTINFCYNLAKLELPLQGNAMSDAFKVYMRDTGLLVSMLEAGAHIDIIDGKLGIYKGAIYENIIADIFTKTGKNLYYYQKGDKLEIDFIIRLDGKIVGVEVKSGSNTKSKSLKTLIENKELNRGIKLSQNNIGVSGKIETYPLYMAMFL